MGTSGTSDEYQGLIYQFSERATEAVDRNRETSKRDKKKDRRKYLQREKEKEKSASSKKEKEERVPFLTSLRTPQGL